MRSRTNGVIGEALVRRVMRAYRVLTRPLRALVGRQPRRSMLDLEAGGWDGDLARMRTTRLPKV